MATLVNKIMPNLSHIFYCSFCDYGTSKKSSFNSHIESKKHKKYSSGEFDGKDDFSHNYVFYDCVACEGSDFIKNSEKNEHKINNSATNGNKNKSKLCLKKFSCENCEKTYSDRTGLWRHKNKCLNSKKKEQNLVSEIKCDDYNKEKLMEEKELIMMLMKQNTELLEVIKNGTHHNSHNNSHNKTFNLQFFLNETCKDAMNIMDFVDSIKLQLSDLEKVGEIGYVEGITNIIVDNLKSLDITQRPVHCTDKKREVLYIKDENKWTKEDEEKNKIRNVIKRVAHKNIRMLPEFRVKHPDCNKSISRYSDQYNKIVVEAMGGSGNNDTEKEDKIIKNITKNVMIDK